MNENDESIQHNSKFKFLEPRFNGQHPLEDFDLNGDVVQLLEELGWFKVDDKGDMDKDPAEFVELWLEFIENDEDDEWYEEVCPPSDEDSGYHKGKFYCNTRRFYSDRGKYFEDYEYYTPFDVLKIWMKVQEIEESPSEYLRSKGYGTDDWTPSRTFERGKLFLKWPDLGDDMLTPVRINENDLSSWSIYKQATLRESDLNNLDFREFADSNPNKVLILSVEELDDQLTAEAVRILSEMLNQGYRAWIEFGYLVGNYSLMPYHEFYLEYLIKRHYEGLFGEVAKYSDNQRALIVRDVLDLYSRLDNEDQPAFVECVLDSEFFINIGISHDLFA